MLETYLFYVIETRLLCIVEIVEARKSERNFG